MLELRTILLQAGNTHSKEWCNIVYLAKALRDTSSGRSLFASLRCSPIPNGNRVGNAAVK